jgi:hypothetical protein
MKLLIMERAERGDPEALRSIIEELRSFLGGEITQLDRSYAWYWHDALEKLLEDTDLWEGAIGEYKKLGLSQYSAEEAVTKSGRRLPEKTRSRFGRALCQVLGLSRPPGQGKVHHEVLTPPVVRKVIHLRLYGASLRRALAVVRSAYKKIDLSDRQIKSWLNDTDSRSMPKPGTSAFRIGQHPRRLRLATLLHQRLIRGVDMELACREVAEIAVTKLCRLPTATVFLDPKTVREAHEYIAGSGDPKWERVKRLAKRFAEKERRESKQAATAP